MCKDAQSSEDTLIPICTSKCIQALENNTFTDEKWRQYCLLLNRNDGLCKQVSRKLTAKLDLSELIKEGYLETRKH